MAKEINAKHEFRPGGGSMSRFQQQLHTLLIYLQASASRIMLSLEILLQPEMFKPCSLRQCSAIALIEASVICSSREMSRARRCVVLHEGDQP